MIRVHRWDETQDLENDAYSRLELCLNVNVLDMYICCICRFDRVAPNCTSRGDSVRFNLRFLLILLQLLLAYELIFMSSM